MKRAVIALVLTALAAPLSAQKARIRPDLPAGSSPPVVHIISGSPLTIYIGDDTSMQVLNSNIGAVGQFFPGDCTTDVADSGVFGTVSGQLYAPNFGLHICGTATAALGSYIPWTPVSFSPVTGNGTPGNPFTEVIVVDAGITGLRLTETLTYVNGATTTNTSFVFSNTGSAAVTWDTFFGADLYLASSDLGIPYLQSPSNAPGGQDCVAQTYTILFLTTTPNDRYSAEAYFTVWAEIAAGLLSDTIAGGCLDNGAANQWQNRTLNPNGSLTINSGVSFSGFVCPPITLAPTTLPGGDVGAAYNQTLTASGGTAPYTFGYTGNLPPGLALSPGGVISGTPTAEGTFTFTVTATDSSGGGGCSGSQTYTIVIGCPTITLAPPSLPGATVGITYNRTITASGGTAPYSFVRSSGSLPPGLTLIPNASASAQIAGTPTTPGSFPFAVTATDASGCTGTRPYTIVVECPTITLTPTLPGGSVGVAYSQTITATGGTAPYAFVLNGNLPPGLTLSSTGPATAEITGTPTASGNFSFSVTTTDADGCTGSQTYAVSICTPPGAPQSPTISVAGNPGGYVTGIDYLDVSWLPPSGGAPPTSYDWAINGRDPKNTTATSVEGVEPEALVVDNYDNGPIELHVFARSCGTPGVRGPEAMSPSYDPVPPVASFAASVSGETVTVTDNSSPQATSWLWLWGDGSYSTEQAPAPHVYPTQNLYTIVLIASNGAGSNQTQQPVQLLSASAATQRTVVRGTVVRAFDPSNPERQRLEMVRLTGSGQKWLHIDANEEVEEKVVYLRFLDEGGKAIVERRLAIAPDQTEAVYNLEAFGLNGSYTLELVSYHGVSAFLVEPAPGREPRTIER